MSVLNEKVFNIKYNIDQACPNGNLRAKEAPSTWASDRFFRIHCNQNICILSLNKKVDDVRD